jgi:hypothetical protein
MTENSSEAQVIDLSIGDPRFAGPILERLVSAAAARAELPVDRVVNALTVVDVLLHAADNVLPGQPRNMRIAFAPGSVRLALDGLRDGQAEAIRDAARVPGLGDVLARTAGGIEVETDGSHPALVVELD